MATVMITDTQKVDLAIAVVDAKGNPAPVEGAPAWASSDESVVTVVAAEDGLSATVLAAGMLGTAQVSVSADADLGAGVETIAGTIDVQVVAGRAVGIALTAGTPAEQ